MDSSGTFVTNYRVRFDEAGEDGHVRPSALVRYIQDVAWQHSAAAGFDRAWYAARRLGWLVRGLELELHAPAEYGDTLQVATRVTGWRRMWARRRSTVTSPSGSTVAMAWIDWVLLDTDGRPVRVPSELGTLAPSTEPFTPLRVTLDAAPPDAARMPSMIRRSDVDPLGHLNNAAYVDLLDAGVAATGRPIGAPRTLQLEYLQPALPDMSVTGFAWSDGDGLAYRLVAPDGITDLLRARTTPGVGGQAPRADSPIVENIRS